MANERLQPMRDVLVEIKTLMSQLVKGNSPSTTRVEGVLSSIETLLETETFKETPGNSVEITYYVGVAAGNPSGATTNIETIVYKTGVTTIITKTITYNANNDILTITIS